MPAASCAADVPADVCCNTFHLIGERIRTVATNAVTACIDESCADREFRSYQMIGDLTQDPHGDSLIVSFLRSSVRTDSRTTNQSMSPLVFTRAEFRVQLLETGWPTIEVDRMTGSILSYDDDMMQALVPHALGHAEKMWRAVVNAAATTVEAQRMFSSSANPHILRRGITVEEMRPLPRPGPMVGFAFNVSVDTKLT